jgi:hypothetical protein
MEELTQLVDKIVKEAAEVSTIDDPHILAAKLTDLASYYTTLGALLHKAENNEQKAENNYKFLRAKIQKDAIKKGEGVKAAELTAIVDTKEDLDHYQDLRHLARLLFLTRQSLDKTMDALRSRLSQIKTEMEGSRHAA